MVAANKGFELSPAVLRYLGDRGISAGFDIYYEPDNPGAPEWGTCLGGTINIP